MLQVVYSDNFVLKRDEWSFMSGEMIGEKCCMRNNQCEYGIEFLTSYTILVNLEGSAQYIGKNK